ncbi:hypothetical protein RclHR1_05060010 [Rhizophagus clarus]|uniref:Uncharacterized protein n=1 Tax=Rhizophagus clarus TaxID=94130 RepID=A0A2Z6SDN9_9GLOM|nr:hypothetical protein RclHR1_05060010 [Rhizophagus clarus]
MANNERGGTIREYIDARKKGGMTWDEFRKLKSEVDGPQFSEYDLVKYRKKLDQEREAKLKGLGSSLNKKKRKKHNHYRRHSSSRDRDRDHKRRRSKSEESPTRNPRNFSDDEYYRSDEDDENYEKRNQHQIDEKDRSERVEKVVIKNSIESGAYESAADSEDKMDNEEDKKHHHHHHHHHHRHSHKKHKNKHKIQEEHRGDTPVRLSEFLKHGSSSSDE